MTEPVAFFNPHKGFYWAKPTKITAPVTVDVEPLALYTQRTWVGLTDEERDGKRVLENGLLFNTAEVQVWEMAVEWAEQKLKERNT